MIKLVVCDIDGTLLAKEERTLSEPIVKALEALRQKGKKLALASGRSYYSMRSVMRELPFADDVYCICDDGALCMHGGKTLYHKPLSIENLLRFERNPAYRELPVLYFSDTFSYVLRSTPDFLEKLAAQNIDRLDPISSVYDMKQPIYKIGVYAPDCRPEPLLPEPFDLRVCYHSENWLEYTSRFADKGLALSDLQMRLYLAGFDTAVFGDGDNDLAMFAKAKYTYARRGGSEPLCAHAGETFDDIAAALEALC